MLHGGNWKRQKMLNPKRKNHEISGGKCSLQFLPLHVERLEQGRMQGSIWRYVPALWDKWSVSADNAIFGAAERFFAGLSENYQKLLVERAVTLYDGRAFRKNRTIPTSLYAKNAAHGSWKFKYG